MDLQLKDKIVLITGGAKGIGAAIARGCAREGAIPVLVDKDGEAGEQLQVELQKSGASCTVICADLLPAANCASGQRRRMAVARTCAQEWRIFSSSVICGAPGLTPSCARGSAAAAMSSAAEISSLIQGKLRLQSKQVTTTLHHGSPAPSHHALPVGSFGELQAGRRSGARLCG